MRTIYLVTGAAGFLGSNVCRQLLDRGNAVRALVLPGDKYAQYLPKEVEIVEGNLCDAPSLEPFFRVEDGVQTIVIHCGSMVTVNPDYNPMLVKVNVDGTQNIIDLCLSHKECQKLVYVGSTGAIPEQPHGTPITEPDAFDPEVVVGWYSKTKAMASQLVLDAVRDQGLNACLVHPTGIMGPNDFSDSTTSHMLLQILRGEMPIGIQGAFNLADVRDLASGCIAAADKGRQGESYIIGNEVVTLKQMCTMMQRETGCKGIHFYMPLSIAAFIARQQEKRAAKTGKAPLMTTFSVYNLKRNNVFDSSKAKRELGYTTRSYAQTIHDQMQWFITSGQYVPGAE